MKPMSLGVFSHKMLSFGSYTALPLAVDELVAEARLVAAAGLASYWLPQQVDMDALTMAGVLGREVANIEIGTAVVPMQTRLPIHMAQAALTAQELSGGRFTLGIGAEHDWVVRDMWGLPFDRPAAHMAEYVEIVTSLMTTGQVNHSGELYQVQSALQRFRPYPESQVIVGALGARMLAIAGTQAQGTTTWLAGLATVRDHIVPTITAAAAQAGRPTPRVIVLLPVAVTDDVAGTRERIDVAFKLYTRMPSYQAMLTKEKVEQPSDVAIIGDHDHVIEQLQTLAAAGATDFGAIVFATDCREEDATWAALRAVAQPGQAGDLA